jgi:hypothetical protein
MRSLSELLQERANLRTKRPDWKYSSFEELILDCGRAMTKISPLSEKGQPKSCYLNCYQLASKLPDITYCEGYALSNYLDLPIAHAWLLTSNGEVIDPTWEEEASAYYGVAFRYRWIKALIKSRRDRGRENDISIFEGNHLEEFSLLKNGLSNDAYLKLVLDNG